MGKFLKITLILFILGASISSCDNGDDYDIVDYDKKVHNVWGSVNLLDPLKKTYLKNLELYDDNSGVYHVDTYVEHDGKVQIERISINILSFRYTKSFGLDLTLENKTKAPNFYIESVNNDSVIFIKDRYNAKGSSIVKFYSKDFLESKGLLEAK